MAKQTYLKRDLIDYVPHERVEPPESGYGGRPEWVVHNLPLSAAIQYWMEGGYQGKLAYVIRLDGYIWIFNDYYGSCSHCDAFIDNERNYTEDMLRKAYCFASKADALEYVRSTDDYSWEGVIGIVEKMVEDPELYLKNPRTRFIIRRRGDSTKYGKGIEGLEVIHREQKDER